MRLAQAYLERPASNQEQSPGPTMSPNQECNKETSGILRVEILLVRSQGLSPGKLRIISHTNSKKDFFVLTEYYL